jgi:hypothetical protein
MYCSRAALALIGLAVAGTALAAPQTPSTAPAKPVAARTAAPVDRLPDRCQAPETTAFVDGPLPRFARRVRSSDPLTIVVMGSGSAAGSGTSHKEAAFPYRLETRLGSVYPKAKVKLVVFAETGQTAPSMYARLAQDVLPLKPALVVWQTGSADVARGIPVMDFGGALERGVSDLQAKGTDVLLVDSQFSPRASLLINTDSYRETVRWAARRFDVPMLRRYDTMQYWWSNETFDLDVEEKAAQLENADRIHDCIAALLVKLIQRGIAAGPKS